MVEKSKVKTEISSSCEERNFLLKDKKEERKKEEKVSEKEDSVEEKILKIPKI